jgi:membrane protein required for colicin V production
MNVLDIVLLAFAALFIIRGLMKGFIISLATLAGLVLGIYAAVYFSGIMSNFLVEKFHPSATWLHILSFSLTFLVVMLGVILIGKLVEKAVDTLKLGLANKLAGGLFGLVKAVLIASILLFIIEGFDKNEKLITKEVKQKSYLHDPVVKVFPWLVSLTGWKVSDINSLKKP